MTEGNAIWRGLVVAAVRTNRRRYGKHAKPETWVAVLVDPERGHLATTEVVATQTGIRGQMSAVTLLTHPRQ